MSSTFRVFVDGMVGEITPSDLKSTFGQFGEVSEVQTIDHKGFSYVTLTKTDAARVQRCIFALNKTKWKGKQLRLELAKPEWQEVWKERQKRDQELVLERKATQLAKLEKRNKATLLPPPKFNTGSTVDGDDFVPSYPYGWAMVRGRYVPIVRLKKKGREGGFVIDPKAFASSKQNILCHVKPLRVDKILTEIKPETLELDLAAKRARKAEVDRWVRGLIKQRLASGDPIQTLEEYLMDEDAQQQAKASHRKDKSHNFDDDDFEVVGADHSDDEHFEVGDSASFSDIEELMDRANSRTRSTPSQRPSTSASSAKTVDSKASMLSVIDSILSTKKGSDYGDSDSQDFELNPTSGESSDAETTVKPVRQSDSDDSDESEGASDDDSDSDSEISANSFHQDENDEGEAGVVDFESDDDEDQNNKMAISSNEEEGQDSESDEKSDAGSEGSESSLSFEGEYDVESSSSSEDVKPTKHKQRKVESSEESSSEADESDEDSESSLEQEVVPVKGSKKAVESDDEDDINLHIFAPAPKVKSKTVNSSKMDMSSSTESEASDSESQSETKPSKKRARVWAADLQEANKKYAYHELVREEDEKIFAMMRDAPDSAPKSGFKFLTRSQDTPAAPSAPAFSFLNRGSTTAQSAESSVLLAALDAKLNANSSTAPKSNLSSDTADQTAGSGPAAQKMTSEQKAKMFLFSLGSSAQSKPEPTPSAVSSSFVRNNQVDKIQRMWSGTKDAQRQQAQRSHKLASKRIKSQPKF